MSSSATVTNLAFLLVLGFCASLSEVCKKGVKSALGRFIVVFEKADEEIVFEKNG